MSIRRDCSALPALLAALALALAPAVAESADTDAAQTPDLAAVPPAPWAARVEPLPAWDLTGAEPKLRAAIDQARAEIARLLADPATPPGRLAEVYGRLGALFLLREIEAPADLALRNARALAPEDFRWPYYAGYLAMMSGNTDRALGLLEQARALDPDYPTLYVRLGRAHLERSELAEARAALERVAAVPGVASAANFYLGQIAGLERRHTDAVRHLELALEKDPGATEAHWPLAQAYRALGEDARARAHMALVEPRIPTPKDPLLEQVQAAAEQSVPAFERGIYAVDKRDYATAVAEFAAGLKVAPDNLAARVSYARVLYLDGDRGGAERELDRVLAADPGHGFALFLKGVLAQADGDRAGAAALYGRALESEPDHPGVLYFLANLDLAEGRWEAAAAGYARLLGDAAADGGAVPDGPADPARDPRPDAIQAPDRSADAGAVDRVPPPARFLAVLAAHRAAADTTRTAARLEALAAERPGDPSLTYARIRLLALAEDPTVRDPRAALALAERLAFEQPGPPALRVLALAQAAAGEFAAAIRNQAQAVMLSGGWLPPKEAEAMDLELAAYRESRVPEGLAVWPADDPVLAPPPFDPLGPFRDYPAATPY